MIEVMSAVILDRADVSDPFNELITVAVKLKIDGVEHGWNGAARRRPNEEQYRTVERAIGVLAKKIIEHPSQPMDQIPAGMEVAT